MDALEVFKCPLCLDYAESAVSTCCCHQVYCKPCLTSIPAPSYCPSCRSSEKKVTFIDAVAVRRALDAMDVDCPNNCEVRPLKRGNLHIHVTTTCSKRTLRCPCPSCPSAPITVSEFNSHIVSAHGDILFNRAARLFDDQSVVQPGVFLTAQDNRIESIGTPSNRTSRLGGSGMRYCGGLLPKPSCGCCDGKCGPTSGCACPQCMILELNLRRCPLGWLINKEGASCRKGSTGLFYCGRLKRVQGGDGWCGPTNGPQCGACASLEMLARSWYLEVDTIRKKYM